MLGTSSPSRQITFPEATSFAHLPKFAPSSTTGQVLLRSAHRVAPTTSARFVIAQMTPNVIPVSGTVAAADTIGCRPRHTASHADSDSLRAPQSLWVRPQQ